MVADVRYPTVKARPSLNPAPIPAPGSKPDLGKPILTLVAEDRIVTRLGSGVQKSGTLDPTGKRETARALAQFVERARELKASRIRVVATAAMRDASDGASFAARLTRSLGVPVEMITPEEEGALAFGCLASRFGPFSSATATVDIGGGSAQVVLAVHGAVAKVISVPLGAVRITERFGGAKKLAGKAFDTAAAFVDRVLAEVIHDGPLVPRSLIGTGGTVMLAAELLAPRRSGSRGVVTRRALTRLLGQLRLPTRSPKLRAKLAAVPDDRQRIMLAGLLVLDRLMHRLGVSSIRSYQGGLREGVCLSLARRASVASRAGPRSDAVRDYAERVRYERAHSEHVAELALRVYSGLAASPGFRRWLGGTSSPLAQRLLWAAALLHDVGTAVDYASHHRHSRDMILAADLPGFDGIEHRLMANIARYHRKEGPAFEAVQSPTGTASVSEHFARLTVPQRRLVAALAGVLRVADGLDRSHEQRVDSKSVRVRSSKFIEIRISPASRRSSVLTPERRAAERKADVLERVLGKRVRVITPD